MSVYGIRWPRRSIGTLTISSEATTRAADDATLTAAVAAEATTRAADDATEAAARAAADSAEATTRAADDATEAAARAAADTSEATTRASADTALSASIASEATTRAANDATEASARAAADATEASARSAEDAALFAAINALSTNNVAQDTFLVSGGQVVWTSAYNFLVSAASYYIDGTLYASAQQTITLDPAHATLDRIDVIAVDDTGTVIKISGTAASQPSEPDVDPSTQLKLSIVYVAAASSSPSSAAIVSLYAEHAGSPTEWDWTTSGSGFNVNSTADARTGTHSIEGTTVANGAYAQGAKGSGTIDPNAYNFLVFYIKSKVTWAAKRTLQVSLRNAGVVKGSTLTLGEGAWGFTSANTSTYQQIAIPVSSFAVPAGTLVNQIRITDAGGSIGFYIDDVVFNISGGSVQTVGLTQDQADARYQPKEATLTALAALVGTAGVVEQTAPDVFTIRLIGTANATDLLTRGGGDARYQSLEATLTALAGIAGTAGVIEQTSADVFTIRLIGTANATDLLTRAGGDGRFQALDATLTALAGVLTAANKIPYATAADTAAELTLDTDGALAASSDTNVPSQKAVKTYVDGRAAIPSVSLSSGLWRLMGVWPSVATNNSIVQIRSFGFSYTGSAGFSVATTTSYQSSYFRQTRNAAASNNASCGFNYGSWGASDALGALIWRGDASSRGGFRIVIPFSWNTFRTSHRWFVGLVPETTDPCLGGEPSSRTNLIGVGCDSTDTNIQVIRNDGSGTATKVDTGTAPAAAKLYQLVLECAGGGAGIKVTLYIEDAAGLTTVYSDTYSTDISATTFATWVPIIVDNSASTTTQATICFHGWILDVL